MVWREFRQVLVHVEHDGDGDDERDGVEIGAYELLDDVPIKNLDVASRVEKTKKGKLARQPRHKLSYPRHSPFGPCHALT